MIPAWTIRSGGSTTRRTCRLWPSRPLQDSLRKRPDVAEVLYHLGMTYAKLGDKAKARETLERALKLDPKIGGDEARRALASVSQ